jgi:hypothetical protein
MAGWKPDPACQKSEIHWLTGNNRYFDTDTGDSHYPIVLLDTKTMKINRKSKQVDFELLSIIDESSRVAHVEYKGSKYSNFGYWDQRYVLSYEKNTLLSISTSWKSCNGDIISELFYDLPAEDIEESNPIKKELNLIIEKYNLK